MTKITVARLTKLNTMLNTYSHCWDPRSREPSNRMYSWVDEYNSARGTPVWAEYCMQRGFTLSHDAYDCMA